MSELEAKVRISVENDTADGFRQAAENAGHAAEEIERAIEQTRNALEAHFEQMQQSFSKGIKFDTGSFDDLEKAAAGAFAGLSAQAQKWFAATRTPLEQFQAQQKELSGLLHSGAVDAETYGRAMGQVRDGFLKALPPAEALKFKQNELEREFKQGAIGAKEYSLRLREMEREFQTATASANPLAAALGNLRGLFAGVFAAVSVGSLVRTADTMQSLNSQIRNNTASAQEYAAVKKELLAVANRTVSDIEATTQLYNRSSQALSQYGYTQQDILKFTEATNNAMLIGGVAAEQQASALLQLSQALGSGVLQGDEFKSIAESAPVLLDTIAEYMGKSRSEIKKLGSEGKLTADVIYQAISGSAEKFAEQAAKMPLQMGQAMTVFSNNWKKFVDDVMNGTGVTQALAHVVKFVGDNLNIVIPIVAALGAGLAAVLAPAIWASVTAMASATAGMLGLNMAMLANPVGIVVAAVAGLIALLYTFRDEITVCGMSVSDWAATAGHAFDIVVEAITDLVMPVINQLKEWWGQLTEFVNEKVGGWQALFDKVMSAVFGFVSDRINAVVAVFKTAYMMITAAWNDAPKFFGNLGNSIANLFLSAIERMINGAVGMLNGFIGFANSALGALGLESKISTLQEVRFERKNDGGLGRQVADNFNRNYVGEFWGNARSRMMAGKQNEADNKYNAPDKETLPKTPSENKPKTGGRKGGAKGKSGREQDPMSLWEEEIRAQKLAFEEMQLNAEEYREWDLKSELAYWKSKLATVDKNSKTGIRLRQKVLEIEKQLRKKQLDADSETVKEAEKIALHKLEMEQEHAMHVLAMADATNLQKLDKENEFEQKRYELKREALLRLAELEDAAGNKDKAQQIRQGIADLDRKEERRGQQHGHKREQTRKGDAPTLGEMLQSGGKNVWKQAQQQMSQAFTAMLTRTQSFRKSMQQAFKAIGQSFMEEMVTKPLMQTMQRLVQETALWQMFFGTKETMETAAAGKTVGTKTTETGTVVAQNATQAGSGVAAALASIPYVGPALAVAGMAAMIAAVMALIGGGGGSSTTTTTTRIPSAAGGWDIPAGINPLTQLHENEMVLPAEHAQTIRDMAGQSSGGGETIIISTTGGDFVHKKDLAKLLRQMKRDYKFA